jgi:MSHA pilin protein MshC
VIARGFTLVELLACIVIIGVLVAVTGPRFVSYQPFQERGYADEVAASLRYAQRVAVATRCDVQFTVSATGYQAMQRAAAGGVCSPGGAWSTAVSQADANPLSDSAPSGVVMSPATQIEFDWQGRVVGAAPPDLTVGSFRLHVDPFSGLVTVR